MSHRWRKTVTRFLDHASLLRHSLPAPADAQSGAVDAAAEMDHRLRRLSTIFWVVGTLLALAATNTGGGRDYDRLAINAVFIPGAILAMVSVWYVPWRRYHRNLFVLTIVVALVILPLMVAWSGGWDSPFLPCCFFILVFAALYFPRRLALPIALAVTLALMSPLLFGFAPPGGGLDLLWRVLITGATCAAIVIVGRAMADELLRLYGESVARLHDLQRAETTLQVVNQALEQHVTERTAALRRSEERYRELFDNASDLVYTHDLTGRFTAINQATERLFGYTSEEALCLNIRDIVEPEDQAQLRRPLRSWDGAPPIELRARTKAGRSVSLEISPRLIVEGARPVGVQGIARDITERKRLETERKRLEVQLRHQASHDPLTGLPNRALFLDRLERAMHRARGQQGDRFAVLFLDLDRFKMINDSHGHLVGDQLLTAFAGRLRACLPLGDTVARLGGDEFAILLDHVGAPALEIAERIIATCRESFVLGEHEFYTSPSIGIVLAPTGYAQTEDLLRDADIAMYRAKAEGKARYAVFVPGMHARAVADLQLEHDLRRALEQMEFRLLYQPIVALDTGRLTGFEALIRWEDPERGLVMPDEFIPAAEESGLIVPLGWWGLEEACRQLREWQRVFPAHGALSMSVNLSARQFAQPDLGRQIERVLRVTGLAGEQLQLEITESAIMGNAVTTAAALTRLRTLGVRLAIDDFGTGYSSLSYLKRFSLDILKIDKAFVAGLGRDPNDTAIVQAIVSLAHALGLQVTAEGVENGEQAAQLQAVGCELAQGHHFGQAVASTAIEELLARATSDVPHRSSAGRRDSSTPAGHAGTARSGTGSYARQRGCCPVNGAGHIDARSRGWLGCVAGERPYPIFRTALAMARVLSGRKSRAGRSAFLCRGCPEHRRGEESDAHSPT